nr:carbohydrate ABC transporter permease [uncultured Gemmiger sp.]
MFKKESSGEVMSTGTHVARFILFLFMLVVALLTLYPVLYVVFGSFKENGELLIGGINMFPKVWIIDNFVEAWQKADFSVYTMNSVIIAVGVMVLSLISSGMAGYVLNRRNFRFKKLIYGLLLAFMFINVGSVSLRPLFELAIKLNLNTSLFSVIFISAGTSQATYIFLVNSYMNSIPKELDEAATIDGCTFFQVYTHIVLPLLRPILATVALLSFRGGWNEYILPLVFTMTDQAKRPLTVGVTMLKNAGDGAAAWNIMFAGATIAIIPILVIYIFASKYFIEGLTGGAVKG